MASGPQLVSLDDDEYWADLYPIIAHLREQHRTAVTPDGTKVILRRDDAEEIKKRPEFVNDGLDYIEARGFGPGDPLQEWRRYSNGALNGEDHRRLRSLVNRALTPRSADRVRPVVRGHMRDLLERHAQSGEFDVREHIRIVPFLSIAAFLVIPAAMSIPIVSTSRVTRRCGHSPSAWVHASVSVRRWLGPNCRRR